MCSGLDYFCVDVESSGPIPGIHNLLSVGLTHVRRFDGKYQPFKDLYVELRPIFPEFDDAAMAVNKLDVARLESEGLSPEAAMQKIIDWVEGERHGKKDRPVFVAHNAPFDWMFFAYYCGHANVKNSFGYSALDTKALAMGKLDIPWNQTSLKNICQLLKLEPPDPDQLHHAGADARYSARVFCGLMNLEQGHRDG
jgi:DNA polymerase III epsilon subunit-like protein